MHPTVLPDHLYGVVQPDVVAVAAAREHSVPVELPGGGVPGHCQGPHRGQVVHGGHHVVGWEGVVPCDPHHRGSPLQVILAVTSHALFKYYVSIYTTNGEGGWGAGGSPYPV